MIALLALWIGTWASAPVLGDEGMSFERATLREVVHVSAGGSQVRVRFTNRFGDAPLFIGAAAIAVQARDAAPEAGTERALTFGGYRSITVPPHADVLSDPVALAVAPRSNLLIDTYVPGPTGPATAHSLAYTTNYYADGNRTGQSYVQGFSSTYTSWYFIDGVDVSNASARGALVALGDSITDCAGGKQNANDRWTDFLAARIAALPPRKQLGVLNEGISGNRILLSHAFFGPSALARFNDDVLAQTGATDLVILLGVNDIQENPHQYDAAKIEQGLAQLAARAHAKGLRVIGATITPYAGWMTYDERGEATRLAVNGFIRHKTIFDAVADFDAAVRDPENPHRLLPRFDSGDHLHPNAEGHRVMAGVVDLDSL